MQPPTPAPKNQQRIVPCPQCGNDALFAPQNPSRPFCSPRCKSIDLGAWSSESYRVATPMQPSNSDVADIGE